MGAGPSSNSSDSSGGGGTYSAQLKTIQRKQKVVDFIKGGGVTGAIVRGVTGAIKKSKAKAKDRKINDTYLGSSDYQGDVSKKPTQAPTYEGGDGGNNTPTVIKKNIGGNTIQTTAPTEAEVSQSEAANADAAALKVKKRGRSQSIMTSSKGVTKKSANYSLGKPSLLGQV